METNQTGYSAPLNPYRPAGRGDMVCAAIMAVLCVLCVDFYLWGSAGIAAAVCSAALFLTGAVYLFRRRRTFTVYGLFCGLCYLAGAVSLAFTDDGFAKLCTVCAMILFSALALMEFMSLRRWKDGSFRSISDVCYTVFCLTFGKVGVACYALFHKTDAEGSPRRRRSGSVLIGLVLALPVLAIIIPLLSSSDAAFENLLKQLAFRNLGEAIVSVLLGITVFFMLFGRLFALKSTRERGTAVSSGRGIEPTIPTVFLMAVSVVYLLYLVSQLAYFFNAFSGLLPEGYSTAEYARRGFFEMSALCAVNLLLLFLSNLLCRKSDGRTPMLLRLLSLFLCVVSLVLAATVLSKLCLYIRSFGMTRMRILTSVFTVFLGCVFIAVAFRLFFRRTSYMKIALAVGALLLLALAFVNVDRVVAGYNVEAYRAGVLEDIDMDTLELLNSDAVVPYLLELTDDAGRATADRACEILSEHVEKHYKIVGTMTDGFRIVEDLRDWRAWNLTAARARTLLRENLNKYYRPENLR